MSRQTQIVIIALVVAIALDATTIVFSLSRGGIISLFFAACGVGIIGAIREKLSLELWIGTGCLLALFSCCFYVAFDSVDHRLATLSRPLEEYGDRWQIVKDIWVEWQQFPLLGTGLGTHEFVYPMFETLKATGNFDHAENEFAQMLEETGAVGLALVVTFVVMIAVAFFRATPGTRPRPILSAAYGLGFGFLAVILQSFSAFGEHATSIAVLTAVTSAILINLAQIARRDCELRANRSARHRESNGPTARATSFVAIGIFLAALVVALLDADRARVAAAAWEPTRSLIEDYNSSAMLLPDDQLAAVIDNAADAHHAEPDNIKYLFQLAACRWCSVEKHHDQSIPDDIRSENEKRLAARLIEDFKQVRLTCPCFGQAAFMMGELQYLVLDQPAGADLVHLAVDLAPTNPFILIQWAYIQTTLKDYASAAVTCRRYLDLNGLVAPDFALVSEVLIHEAKRPDLAIPLAGNDPDRLMNIVGELRNTRDHPDYKTLASSLEKEATATRKTQLLKSTAEPDAPAADLAALADIYRAEHDFNAAVEYYQKALVLQYDEIEWRMKLAETLLAAGRKDEAVAEASIVLRLHPETDAAQKLISNATAPAGASSGQ